MRFLKHIDFLEFEQIFTLVFPPKTPNLFPKYSVFEEVLFLMVFLIVSSPVYNIFEAKRRSENHIHTSPYKHHSLTLDTLYVPIQK